MQLRKNLVLCMTFKDHLATQLLDIIKGHPEWASFVIRLTALAELSLLFSGTAILVAAGTLAEGVLDDFLDETPEAEALEAASRIARQKVFLRNSTRQQIGPQNDPEKTFG
jgi:hypothetical protein